MNREKKSQQNKLDQLSQFHLFIGSETFIFVFKILVNLNMYQNRYPPKISLVNMQAIFLQNFS